MRNAQENLLSSSHSVGLDRWKEGGKEEGGEKIRSGITGRRGKQEVWKEGNNWEKVGNKYFSSPKGWC